MKKNIVFLHFYLITFNFMGQRSGCAARWHEIISYSPPSLSVSGHPARNTKPSREGAAAELLLSE